jgi:hypothetical protein
VGSVHGTGWLASFALTCGRLLPTAQGNLVKVSEDVLGDVQHAGSSDASRPQPRCHGCPSGHCLGCWACAAIEHVGPALGVSRLDTGEFIALQRCFSTDGSRHRHIWVHGMCISPRQSKTFYKRARLHPRVAPPLGYLRASQNPCNIAWLTGGRCPLHERQD